MTVSKMNKIIRKAASMVLCLALLFSSACSSKAKETDGKTVPADEAYFTSETLDLSSAIEGEYAGIEAVKQFRDGIGILLLVLPNTIFNDMIMMDSWFHRQLWRLRLIRVQI